MFVRIQKTNEKKRDVMKIEIYKERDIPMFSVDGEIFVYDDYALNTLALTLIDNKYDGITSVEVLLLDNELIGIKNVIDKLVDEIFKSDKSYEEFMKDLGE